MIIAFSGATLFHLVFGPAVGALIAYLCGRSAGWGAACGLVPLIGWVLAAFLPPRRQPPVEASRYPFDYPRRFQV